MANPRRTIYVVYFGCKTDIKSVWFHNGNDFVTEDYKTAEDELYRLKEKLKKIYFENIYSPELEFIVSHKKFLNSVCIHISEITPNGESTTLKIVDVFQK